MSHQRVATPLAAASAAANTPPAAAPPPRTSVLARPKPGTAAAPGGAATLPAARPMTATRAAHYSPLLGLASGSSGATARGTVGAIMGSSGAREQCEALEERIHQLLEECTACAAAGDTSRSVDAAREAARREQRLRAMLSQAGPADQASAHLRFAVGLGLGAAYEANHQLGKALAVYSQVLQCRLCPQADWLRLNIGAILFQQHACAQAVKQFRMALDAIPPTYRRLRLDTTRNIGLAFVQAGRYQEAVDAFTAIVQDGADHHTAFNLVLCAAAQRDATLMRQCFTDLLQVACDQPVLDAQSSEEDATMRGAREQDVLHVQLETRQAETDGYILSAARLVAPLLYAHSWTKGFDWCREQLNAASLGALASEVHLAQANEHLARKCYAAAVVLLKEFARGDSRQRAAAAVNLTTLSLLDGRLEAAAGYGDYCCEANPGSAQPMISRANVHMAQAQAEMALQLYEDALQLEASSPQALFNCGLACRTLGLNDRALAAVQSMLHAHPSHAEAMWQAADMCEELRDAVHATDWLSRLLTRAPRDSGLLSRLGMLNATMGAESEALALHTEAFTVDCTNLDAVTWLGAHYVRRQDYPGAIPFFEAAARVQPRESKWPLMVAGCLRRVGRLEAALLRYREVYRVAPTNTEALRYLSQLSQEFGLQDDLCKFSSELARIEHLAAARTMQRPGTSITELAQHAPLTTARR